jgi:3-isopropylmalate dehydrogenase
VGEQRIAVLGGDGVGPEVTAEAVRVLRAVAQRFGHRFDFQERLAGQDAVAREGAAITDETMAVCAKSDAVLFGAAGGTQVGDPRNREQPEHSLYRLRTEFTLFANLRPVRTLPALLSASPLKRDIVRDVDLLVVRELTAGLYFSPTSEIRGEPPARHGIDLMTYTEDQIERVVRIAFELASTRQRQLTSVDKANVLSCSRLWRDVAERVARDYPDVTLRHLLVDNCAMNLVKRPREFDVLVMENMFGDILTDEASMLAGSMGMLPSASLGTRRTAYGQFGLYEPIHGTATRLAGQGKANPLAAILSAAMLLRHSLSLPEEARAVETAVEQTVAAGYRTYDIATPGTQLVSTGEMGEQVARALLAPPAATRARRSAPPATRRAHH